MRSYKIQTSKLGGAIIHLLSSYSYSQTESSPQTQVSRKDHTGQAANRWADKLQ